MVMPACVTVCSPGEPSAALCVTHGYSLVDADKVEHLARRCAGLFREVCPKHLGVFVFLEVELAGLEHAAGDYCFALHFALLFVDQLFEFALSAFDAQLSRVILG